MLQPETAEVLYRMTQTGENLKNGLPNAFISVMPRKGIFTLSALHIRSYRRTSTMHMFNAAAGRGELQNRSQNVGSRLWALRSEGT